jgi:chitin disaccharide deacetylase
LVHGRRYLLITADDYGIGPATSQGILDLAASGVVTGSVLLVNSPHAEEAVRAWQRAGRPMELGWHPCLTLDRPLTPVGRVPSLVNAEGCFRPLAGFLRRLCLGQIRQGEVEIELRAQYGRYHDLLGQVPAIVNAHHHIQVFPQVGALLRRILGQMYPLPYLRCVREPWSTIAWIPGARAKRTFLSLLGRQQARRQQRRRFPGNDWLAGITDPLWVADPLFLLRWLARIPGAVVELTCHPGYLDRTLIGRDCSPDDGQLQRRIHELQLLRQPNFRAACGRAGFTLVSASELSKLPQDTAVDAA